MVAKIKTGGFGTPQQPDQVVLDVAVLTSTFQVQGKLSILGVTQTFINDEQKPSLTVAQTVVTGLDVINPAATMQQAEMIVLKRGIHAMLIQTALPSGQMMLMARSEPLVLYTDRYAVEGNFHMSPDARVADFSEVSLSMFIVASNARVYPLFPCRPGLVESAPIVVMHKENVQAMHYQQR